MNKYEIEEARRRALAEIETRKLDEWQAKVNECILVIDGAETFADVPKKDQRREAEKRLHELLKLVTRSCRRDCNGCGECKFKNVRFADGSKPCQRIAEFAEAKFEYSWISSQLRLAKYNVGKLECDIADIRNGKLKELEEALVYAKREAESIEAETEEHGRKLAELKKIWL